MGYVGSGTQTSAGGGGGSSTITSFLGSTTNGPVNVTQVGGAALALGQQLAGASLPVVLTSAQLSTLTPLSSVTVTQATGSNLHAVLDSGTITTVTTVSNVAQINGVNPTFNSTATSGKQAIDINILSILGTAPTTVGKLDIKGADGDVFVRQATGSNLHMVVDSGTVTTVSTVTAVTSISNAVKVVGNAGAIFDGATGSAVPANVLFEGDLAKTALPTAVSDGQLVGQMADKFGRQVVLPVTIRDLTGTQTTTISASVSETTIVSQAASVFNDLLLLVLSNTSATATRVDFRDTTGGSVLFSLYVPAGDTRGFSLGGVAIPQTSVNTNWTAQSSVSITDLRIYAVFAKNK